MEISMEAPFEQKEVLQERPNTPELHQQESHVFSDVTHPTDTSPTQSPPQHGSSQPHYTQANPQDHSYPQTEHEEHGYYPEPQSQSCQEGRLAGHDGYNGHDDDMESHASYAAPHPALPSGQTHHAQSAACKRTLACSLGHMPYASHTP